MFDLNMLIQRVFRAVAFETPLLLALENALDLIFAFALPLPLLAHDLAEVVQRLLQLHNLALLVFVLLEHLLQLCCQNHVENVQPRCLAVVTLAE